MRYDNVLKYDADLSRGHALDRCRRSRGGNLFSKLTVHPLPFEMMNQASARGWVPETPKR